MNTDLSLFDVLTPLAGFDGKVISLSAYEAMVQYIAQYAQRLGVRNIVARLQQGKVLESIPETLFFVTPEQHAGQFPRFAQFIRLSANHALAADQFILIADAHLPFLLVARGISKQQVRVFISNDFELIEGTQTIIAGFDQVFLPMINGYGAKALQYSSDLVTRLALRHGDKLVVTWFRELFFVPPTQVLATAQQLLGATYLRWDNHKVGQRPPAVAAYDGIHQHQKLLGINGEKFEAVGMVNDRRFIQRCQFIVGVLPLLMSRSQPPVSAPTASATQDNEVDELLASFSLEAFMSQVADELSNSLTDRPAESSVQHTRHAATPTIAPAPATRATAEDATARLSASVLQHISQQINLLRDDILNSGILQSLRDEMAQPMQRFINQSTDLLFLIDEVTYIHQVAQRLPRQSEPIAVGELVNAIVITFAGEAERRGVELTFEMPNKVPLIHMDPEALNRALVVLLEFALERLPHHGWIRIEVVSTEPQLQIHIMDNGEPFEVENPDALFQPIFSADGTTKLGLALVETIMRVAQGNIRVQREKNVNIFTLSFKRT